MPSISIKSVFIALLLAGLSACGGGGNDSASSGGGSSSTGGPVLASCTADQIVGSWRITVTALLLSETEVVTIDQEEAESGALQLNGNNFSYTEDGDSLNGSFNSECNRMSGSARVDGISGDFTGVKL